MEDRRAISRHRSFMQGRVYFNHRRSSMDCIIREFTDIGGKLEFSGPVTVPDVFEVYVPSKDQYFRAETIWRKSSSIGVKWVTEESPHLVPEISRSGDPIGDRLTKLEHDVAVLRKRLDALGD